MCPFIDVISYDTFEYRAQDEGARGKEYFFLHVLPNLGVLIRFLKRKTTNLFGIFRFLSHIFFGDFRSIRLAILLQTVTIASG